MAKNIVDTSLGNNSNKETTDKNIVSNKGAIDKRYNVRNSRFKLLRKISDVLFKNANSDDFKSTKYCFTRPISYSQEKKTGLRLENDRITINYSRLYNKASYSKIFQCGNVWLCPVCSARINVKRSKEIEKTIDYAYQNGYKVAMITFTNPHVKDDKLADIIEKHNNALKKVLNNNKSTLLFYKRIGNPFKYRITAKEVTYGRNGWHWHTHILMFTSKDADITKEYDYLLNKWYKYCLEEGFVIKDKDAFFKYGLDIIDNMSSSQYLTKYGKFWGIDKEFTNKEAKNPKNGNIAPFYLLDAGYEKQFVEYAYATKGRKQITWSNGLKRVCGIREKTDKELVKEEDEKANNVKIAEVDSVLWQLIMEKKLEASILRVIERFGGVGLIFLLYNNGLSEYVPRMNINTDYITEIYSNASILKAS